MFGEAASHCKSLNFGIKLSRNTASPRFVLRPGGAGFTAGYFTSVHKVERVLARLLLETLRKNSGAILRLLMVVCLFQGAMSFGLFTPSTGGNSALKTAVQGGVGGGSTVDAVVTEVNISEPGGISSSLETGVLEPESFSKPRMLLYSSYTIKKGDIIGDLAGGFGLSQDTLLSANGIKNSRLIQIGQVLRIPNQDGIFYTVKKGDTIAAIAEKYQSGSDEIRIANELFSDTVKSGETLFIPGARMDWVERQEINGDLFIWPTAGYITSPYGYRKSPFTGIRQFHSGLDIGSAEGTAVRAAMSGRVHSVGWDPILGNYAVINHHSGYRTMYGHMSVVRVKSGAYVGTGERIGNVGSTGLSTGPHLHFTVYKSGITVNPRTLMK